MPLSEAVPSVCDPEKKTTEPVAAPQNWLVTVAVKVTGWPVPAGLRDEARVVVVVARLTVCVSGLDVLGAKPAPPRYLAVIEFAPTGSDETGIDTLPFVSVPLTTWVRPSRTITVPVGVPELEAT